jgi:hypothetical protein
LNTSGTLVVKGITGGSKRPFLSRFRIPPFNGI